MQGRAQNVVEIAAHPEATEGNQASALLGRESRPRRHMPAKAAAVAVQEFAGASITEVNPPPGRVVREHLWAPSAGGDGVYLIVHLRGEVTYQASDGSVAQSHGDVLVVNGARQCEAVYSDGARCLSWHLPKSALAPFLSDDMCGACTIIRPAKAWQDILASFALGLARQGSRLDPGSHPPLLSHLCVLVALAISSTAPPTPCRRTTSKAHARQRILAYVEARFREPGLSATQVARDLGMSQRSLHAALADGPMTFAELVARHRLDESLRLLNTPSADHLSITEIAFQAGFGDLSTFYRRFRTAYGATPRDVRRRRAP